MQSKKYKLFKTGKGCKFYGNVKIGRNSILGDYVILGYPKERRLLQLQQRDNLTKSISQSVANEKQSTIGENCIIDSHVIIHEGTLIKNNVIINDFCRIGYDCTIDTNSRLVYKAYICDRVKIAKNCVLSGFICDGTVIEEYTTVMGQLVHKYSKPELQWEVNEPSPYIEHHSVVGYGALVIGGVRISHHSYIAAGAIITKNVPPKSIVVGLNKIIPYNKWRGKQLSKKFWGWK